MADIAKNFSDSANGGGQPAIRCLALDIGNVIAADTWETLFFAPGKGLAARYGLDAGMVERAGAEIWKSAAYSGTPTEEDYWQAWEARLGHDLDRSVIAKLYEDAIWCDRTAADVVNQCLAQGIGVAIVSNSTPFWFPKQMKASGLDAVVDRLKLFLSHEVGFSKAHPQGGLALLAAAHDPASTLFVDDRLSNIEAARKLGMQALHYTRQEPGTLAQALGPVLFPQGQGLHGIGTLRAQAEVLSRSF